MHDCESFEFGIQKRSIKLDQGVHKLIKSCTDAINLKESKVSFIL